MLNRLPPKERQIVDLLYSGGEMTAAEVAEALPQPLSGSAVRTMLKRLEDKGFVRRSESERGFLYSPTVSDQTARKPPCQTSFACSSTGRPPVPQARCWACRTSSTPAN